MSGLSNKYFSESKLLVSIAGSLRSLFHRGLRRKVACLAIILNMLIWPVPGVTLKTILYPVPALASTVGSTLSTLSSAGGELGSFFSGLAASIVFIHAGPIIVPVPLLPLWAFQLGRESAREMNSIVGWERSVKLLELTHKVA
ncbi:MAG: hypothetical protein AABO57_28630 [Acidobacteriota bacterium]